MINKKVFMNDLSLEFKVDGIASDVMECIISRVSEELYNQMYDYLLGFNADMQLVIADNLLDNSCYGWEHYTGIDHVDEKLRIFYFLIDKELGRI